MGAFLAADPAITLVNMIPAAGIDNYRGWYNGDPDSPAVRQHNGFWRITRQNSQGHDITKVYAPDTYPVVTGQGYTQSAFLRHDGTFAADCDFLTAAGQHVIGMAVQDLGNGLIWIYASYNLVQPGDNYLRGVELTNFAGDWTWLEIFTPTLRPAGEEPPVLSPFQLTRAPAYPGNSHECDQYRAETTGAVPYILPATRTGQIVEVPFRFTDSELTTFRGMFKRHGRLLPFVYMDAQGTALGVRFADAKLSGLREQAYNSHLVTVNLRVQ